MYTIIHRFIDFVTKTKLFEIKSYTNYFKLKTPHNRIQVMKLITSLKWKHAVSENYQYSVIRTRSDLLNISKNP